MSDNFSTEEDNLSTENDKSNQELVANLGTYLSLYHQDENTDSMKRIMISPMYSHIFSVSTLVIPSAQYSHDYLAASSDSGNITIFDLSNLTFSPIICIPYARVGMRRTEPGFYMCASPCGRVIFTSAIQKNRVAWTLTKDDKDIPIIRAPIETSRSHSITEAVVALDVGYESPLFATLERYHKGNEVPNPQTSKLLVLYEIDANINTIVRRGDIKVQATANYLVAVPGPLFNCPGGVLICGEGTLQWIPKKGDPILSPLPRRRGAKSSIIVNSSVYASPGETPDSPGIWFILLQNQYGDLIYAGPPQPEEDDEEQQNEPEPEQFQNQSNDQSDININNNNNNISNNNNNISNNNNNKSISKDEEEDDSPKLITGYFDTVPKASSINILSQGRLAVFGESGDDRWYNIRAVSCDDVLEFTPNEIESPENNETTERRLELLECTPKMTRLTKCLMVHSTSGGQNGELVSTHGSHDNSSLKLTLFGVPITYTGKTTIGGSNSLIRSLKPSDSHFHSLFLVSASPFTGEFEGTRHFAITLNNDKQANVSEVAAAVSPFVTDYRTLDLFTIHCMDASISTVQVHTNGVRVLHSEFSSTQLNNSNDSTDSNSVYANIRVNNWTPEESIVACSGNEHQIMLLLSGGILVLQNAGENGNLVDAGSFTLPDTYISSCVALPDYSQVLAKWVAVGGGHQIHILSLEDGDGRWKELASQQLRESSGHSIGTICALRCLYAPGITGMILFCGTTTGRLFRTIVSEQGALLDTQEHLIGFSPVTFSPARIENIPSLILNSSISWIARGLELRQLSMQPVKGIAWLSAPFSSDSGLVALSGAGDTLSFLDIPDLSCRIDTRTFPLKMTPRQLVLIPNDTETEHRIGERVAVGLSDDNATTIRIFNAETEIWEEGDVHINGSLTAMAFVKPEVMHLMQNGVTDLENFSEGIIIVGIANELQACPRRATSSSIQVISVKNHTIIRQVEKLPEVVGAIAPFQEFIAVGIGNILRLYGISKSHLLTKSESRVMPTRIMSISTFGNRIIMGDSQESFMFLKFERSTKLITPFADDMVPRKPISAVGLDGASVSFGDRFGNFGILRLPRDVSDEAEIDPALTGISWEAKNYPGCPNKAELAASYHIGDLLTGLSLSASGKSLIYGTIGGMIGALIPVNSDADVTMLKRLEGVMKQRQNTPCGRIHELFRSYYAPLKAVSDGDLLREYTTLKSDEQKKLAQKVSESANPFELNRLLMSVESLL